MSSNSDSDPATEPPGADVGRRYGLHPTRWYLVETLTDSPTVIAEDDTARRCRPLKNMFRGPALPAVSAVVSEVRATRKSAHAPIPRVFGDLESLIGIPVFGPSGEVFAVQVTCRDKSHAQRPPTPVVAGWEFEIRSPEHPLRTQWTSQFRQLYGIADSADKDLPKESMGLADLYKRAPRPSDVARLMTGVIDARDGHLDDGTLVIRRDDDALRLVRYVRRAISDKGSTWLRGIDHDITSTTSTGDLAIATLDAEIASTIARTTGTHCALIDARTGLVISWVSEPVEGLDDDTIGGRTPPAGQGNMPRPSVELPHSNLPHQSSDDAGPQFPLHWPRSHRCRASVTERSAVLTQMRRAIEAAHTALSKRSLGLGPTSRGPR